MDVDDFPLITTERVDTAGAERDSYRAGQNSRKNSQMTLDEDLMTTEVLEAAQSYHPEEQSLIEEEYHKKIFRYQVVMFSLCYFSYGSVHIYREFWSQSKPKIEDEYAKYHSDKQTLSNVDFANFMIYGLTQFANGAFADQFNLKMVLPIIFVLQACIYALIAMTGFLGGEYAYVQFYVWFSLLGLVQSICFPAFIHIVANWFSEKNRGVAVGGFCTCINIGDIIGAQVGQGLLSAFDNKWQWLFVILTGLNLVLAILIAIFLVQHPEHIGLTIDDQLIEERVTEKMQYLVRTSQSFIEDRNSESMVPRGTTANPKKYHSMIAISQDSDEYEDNQPVASGNGNDMETKQRRTGLLGSTISKSMTKDVIKEKEAQVETRISFWQAWLLPKVIFYAFAYFCAKMALQVVFFSLFEFLDDEFSFGGQKNANISTMNDVGGLIGSLAIGYISDLTYRKRSPATFVSLFLSCVIWYMLVAQYNSITYTSLMVSFFFYGLFMQGVTNTIAATCSADIGKAIPDKNTKAVSTVTGIIDGMGSVGAAIGQFIVGWTQTAWGWRYGYILLTAVMQTVTLIPLGMILYGEIIQIKKIRAWKRTSESSAAKKDSGEREPSAKAVF